MADFANVIIRGKILHWRFPPSRARSIKGYVCTLCTVHITKLYTETYGTHLLWLPSLPKYDDLFPPTLFSASLHCTTNVPPLCTSPSPQAHTTTSPGISGGNRNFLDSTKAREPTCESLYTRKLRRKQYAFLEEAEEENNRRDAR